MTRKVTASCSHKRLLGIALSPSFSWSLNHPHARPYTLTQRKKHAACQPFSLRVAPSHSLSIGNFKVYPLPTTLSSPSRGEFLDYPFFPLPPSPPTRLSRCSSSGPWLKQTDKQADRPQRS